VGDRKAEAFATWITGLPASGKSVLAAAVKAKLDQRGVDIAVLESDELRKVLTPHPRYDEQERDSFYRQMVYIGALLVEHGVPVVFDATANLRSYRARARKQFRRYVEIYVECPLPVCMDRDPKGIYRQALEGETGNVPGLQTPYEPPETPDVVIHSDREAPDAGADRVMALLTDRGWAA